MPASLDQRVLLQRVLALEKSQGYKNRSASGGLPAFLQGQIRRADPATSTHLAEVSVLLAGYEEADRNRREEAVKAASLILAQAPGHPVARDNQSAQVARDGSTAEATPVPRKRLRPSATPAADLVADEGADVLDQPIEIIKGIGAAAVAPLKRCGVATIRDLLYYVPRSHYDYRDTSSIARMRVGEPMTLVGTIVNVRNNRTARGLSITTATISDASGVVAVRWFNQPYLAKNLKVNARIAVTGVPEINNGNKSFLPKDYELIKEADLTHAARLVPVYPLTKGLFQRALRRLIKGAVDTYAGALVDPLPESIRESISLIPLSDAVQQYHFPDDEDSRRNALQRLAFDELLLIQLGFLMRKERWREYDPSIAITVDEALSRQFLGSLPFPLTGAQQRAIDTLLQDVGRPTPMNRLLQGDVGSGKTVVAAALVLQAVRSGTQAVVMAPTEILAEQHLRTLETFLQPFGVRCELLVGSISKSKRRPLYEAAQSGAVDLLVGTHALIQEPVQFYDLGLAITDEQHRFGVEQRGTLRQKGLHPHTLAMTATPIPRSLALTVYGDLDVTSIDEMPPGRLPPITTWVPRPQDAYSVMRQEIEAGHQAFVICPVIEESIDSDMRSVLEEHRELQSMVFPNLKVGLLHGRMKASDKESVLRAFRDREYQILVATSVIEVGIDIPNATVVVVRDAHRFGLAQLHQFRGRVGRGGDQAYCVLLSASEGDEARERLDALSAMDDGFQLAEEDLRLRGPGEFWGTRQSGLPALKLATLGDLETIQKARHVAQEIIEEDADLSSSQHRPLQQAVRRFWAESADIS
jgi:ATP-dependent DNA helicase RecG